MNVRSLSLRNALLSAAILAVPVTASAQSAPSPLPQPYNTQPQPYNIQDPQNYGSPAAQSYYGQQQQAPAQQQQPGYPQQPGYAQQQQPLYNNPQQDQQQQYAPNAYDNGQQQQGQYSGQEQVYQAPPPLPNYDQPESPGDGYLWTPGYWAFGPGGYFWVPGAWVAAPYEGALWTPGYWGYGGSGYLWNAGYWGNSIGFYGGINYGFGYFGTGFYGGYWRDHRFFYNREYSRVGGGFHNVYNQRFSGVVNVHPGGASFTSSRFAGNQFRGGSYNNQGRSQIGVQNTNQFNGQAGGQFRGGVTSQYPGSQRQGSPQPAPQTSFGRPGNSGGYNPATINSARPTGQQGFQGSFQHNSAPAANSYHPAPSAAPSAGQQHFSAPAASGAGGFHGGGGGGGGGSHGGGGHR